MKLFDRLTSVLLVIAVGYVLLGDRQPVQTNSEGFASGVGKLAPSIDSHPFEKTGTLILSLRSTCRFCTNSMPFYRRLLEDRKQIGVAVRVVVVSTEPREVTQAYLTENGVTADFVVQVNAANWRDYLRTPTLLQVDSKGVIVNQWTGQLTPDEEKRVLSALYLVGP